MWVETISTFCEKSQMIDESIDATTLRMRKVRAAYGQDKSQEEFAASLNLTDSAWSNYEKSRRPGLDAALLLVRRFPHLTLEWIYRGDPRGMAADVFDKLESSLEETTRRAARR